MWRLSGASGQEETLLQRGWDEGSGSAVSSRVLLNIDFFSFKYNDVAIIDHT